MHLFIDIGGTNTRITTSERSDTFSKPIKVATPQNFDEAMSTFDQQIKELTNNQTIANAVVGIPGVFDQDKGQLSSSPNLLPWINKPIAKQLTTITKSPITFVNDSDLAGLGEAAYGAGQNYNIVAYLTISTGIGGARIVKQKIDEMTYGFEPGFHIVDAGGSLCPNCHKPSSLEDLIGGGNTKKGFNCHPKDIKDPKVWNTYAQWLAYGLNNIVALWSPEVIILGGPMMRDISIKQVIEYTHQLVTFTPQPPDIKPAALGDDRAFYGALALVNTDTR